MNYRHAYHAGNFADVLKHVTLALVIEHLKLKAAPFRVIDTHAGIGLYDLEGDEASRTGEWRDGIGRLVGPGAPPIPTRAAEIMRPYLDAVALANPPTGLKTYPGSPVLALTLMRAGDRLIANELHPSDVRTLAATIGRDPRAGVLELDGWLALKSQLPPRERRGVVLIDPPFEATDEFDAIVRGLHAALRRFATGTYLIWYPIKISSSLADFRRALAATSPAKAFVAGLLVRSERSGDKLSGCGLVAVNPPHTLLGQLQVLLPFLAQRLGQDAHSTYRIGGLIAEPLPH